MIISHFPSSVQRLSVGKVLNDNDWETISKVSGKGQAQNYWAVGDTKKIRLNGTVGKTTFDNLAVWVFIIGFDHNSAIEGKNTIHFQIGKSAQTSGMNLCLIDSKNDSYTTSAGYFNMNYSKTNNGGWESCMMRTVLLGSNYAPSSPLSGSLLAALPSALLAIMKDVTKYTDNTGGGTDTESNVTSTTDYLWLLSEWEVQGAKSYANSAEQNYQQQYTYYADGNSKIFYEHSDPSTVTYWWSRSPSTSSEGSFCRIDTSGSAASNYAYYSRGVAPAFCV